MTRVLVDTSIWIDHFRSGVSRLKELLLEEAVVCHPFVVGELACGNLKNRNEILAMLQALPLTPSVSHEEALHLIDHHQLMGTGLGWVDVHLLASARLAQATFWTADRPLRKAATALEILYR